MAERKTQETDASVADFIGTVPNETRRQDSIVVARLMENASGKKPKMWGTGIIGCGKRFYKYANGKQAEICKIGFAPRAKSLVFYLASFPDKSSLLKRLGKHSARGGCLYINKLEDVDIGVLEEILEKAYLRDSES